MKKIYKISLIATSVFALISIPVIVTPIVLTRAKDTNIKFNEKWSSLSKILFPIFKKVMELNGLYNGEISKINEKDLYRISVSTKYKWIKFILILWK